ncbi:MAG: hypothetical protein WC763_00090 [Candidatus Paceibacterota bacterium]|jgi:hypothetical protein
MDKKSKALSWVIALAVISSIGITFYKTVVVKDFVMVGADEGGESLPDNASVEFSSTTEEVPAE